MKALLLLPLLAGCELFFDDPGKKMPLPGDAPGVDPIESIAGKWRQVPSHLPGDQTLAEIEFRVDGTFTSTTPTIASGKWSVENGSLTMSAPDGHTHRHAFVLESDRLVTHPYMPFNSNQGIVGTWAFGSLRDDGTRTDSTIVLGANRTAAFTTPTEQLSGTWREVASDELAIKTTIAGTEVELSWRFIGNQRALGFPLYARVK